MANKKISELESRASLSLSDLMAVGDPSTGYLYKTTISDLKTLTGAGVVSFNGRFGTVNPAEGDYTLTQLGDVIITSPSNGQVLKYNGSNWVNATEVSEADTLATVTARGNVTTGDIAVNGKITIGTAFPGTGQRIEANAGAGSFDFVNSSGGGFYYRWIQNGATAMQLSTANNLLIGTVTDSGYKLDVAGSAYIGSNPNAVQLTVNGAISAVAGAFLQDALSFNGTNRIIYANGLSFTTNNSLSNLEATRYLFTQQTPSANSGTGVVDLVKILMPVNTGAGQNVTSRGLVIDFSVTTNGGSLVAIDAVQGTVRLRDLSGTGSRMVVADANGVLSTQAIPSTSGFVTLDTFQTITASKTFSVGFSLASAGGSNQLTTFANANSIHSGSAGSNIFGFNNSNNIYFGKGLSNGGVIAWNNSAVRSYTLPDATGTIALTSDIPSLSNYVTLDTTQTITALKTFTNVVTFNQNIVGGLIKLSQGMLLSKSANIGSDPGFLSVIAQTTTGLNYINFVDGDNFSFFQRFAIPNTATYTYTFPSSSGTLALASSLSSYLPLSGGTLTGALNGTSASFSSTLTATGTINGYAGLNGYAGATHNLLVDWSSESQITTLTATDLFFGTSAQRRMTIKADGKVGIATASPNATLDIGSGDIYVRTGVVAVNTVDSYNTTLTLKSNGTSAIHINQSQNIGIGTTSANIAGYGGARVITLQASIQPIIELVGSTYNAGDVYGGGAISFRNASAAVGLIGTENKVGNQGELVFYTNDGSTFSKRMTILPGGNVGIATTTPSARLSLGMGVGAKFLVYDNPSTGVYSGLGQDLAAGDSLDLFAHGLNNYGFITFGKLATNKTTYTEWARFTPAGNFGIGTTAANRKLVVVASTGGSVTEFYNERNNGSGDFVLVTVLGANDANTSNYHYIGTTGGADRCYIYGNGNIVNSNNSYGALSDIRLKENITDTASKLADLLKVKVRNYNLIGDDKKQIGVIAQELETIFPGMIEVDGKSGMKQVKYSVFVPMLIKAMQEQQAQIEQLKAK